MYRINSICTFFVLFFFTTIGAQNTTNYQKGWEALNNNQRKEARQWLDKAAAEPASKNDATLTLLLLDYYENQDDSGHKKWDNIYGSLDPVYPYLFALWFKEFVCGDYGMKDASQLKLLKNILNDPKCPSMLQASAKYQMRHHLMTQNRVKEMLEICYYPSMLNKWQFTGPFDNTSDSGFDKDYPPIREPRPSAVFKAANNSDIHWIAPEDNEHDGWNTPGFNLKFYTGIVYAQTFVQSPDQKDVVLGIGYSGNCKVWVNDRLVFAEPEQRRTDYDIYRVPATLLKGNNRILVQLGAEESRFPNFSVRLLDKEDRLIEDITSSNVYQDYTIDKSKELPSRLPFFAESFFENKIKSQPSNLLNYCLLSNTYRRSGKFQEALKVIKKALEIGPDNSILHYQLLEILNALENRTDLTTELERFYEKDSLFFPVMVMRGQEAINREQFDEAMNLMEQIEKDYGEDQEILQSKIIILIRQQKYEKMIELIEKGYREYPDNPYYTRLAYALQMEVQKNPAAAMRILETYLGRNYDVEIAGTLSEAYFEAGMNNKALDILEHMVSLFPSDPFQYEALFDYYYNKKDYKKAKEYLDIMLELAPFYSPYWEKSGNLQEQLGNKTASIEHFQKALQYDPNSYDLRSRIRLLEQKPELVSQMPQSDPYDLIKKTVPEGKDNDTGWYYVLDESSSIIYPEGNWESYNTIVAKVLNEKGIDYWKESTIGYNDNNQHLIIEKAEVVKPNGNKIKAERNDNELVFPNIEKGDCVLVRYRIQSYAFGRISRKFWEEHYFKKYVHSDFSRYNLLVAKNIQIQYKGFNFDQAPQTESLDGFTRYTWEVSQEPPIKEESFIPNTADLSKVLHISTFKDWGEISEWYSDISKPQAKVDYEMEEVYDAIFEKGKTYAALEKAQMIYDYIVKNIRYSSVPFRQGSYVPQKASKVVQTKLGDCKDLSTLYVTLARMAGLDAILVLVDTRDNGANHLLIPSVDFNHCIAKVTIDGVGWYLELTDEYLPFGTLSHVDVNATVLEIPYNNIPVQPAPFYLQPANRTKNFRVNQTAINIKNKDFVADSRIVLKGTPISGWLSNYHNLTDEKRKEDLQDYLGEHFTNPVNVKSASFEDELAKKDSIEFGVNYVVKNEVIEIGSLRTFKVPFYYAFIKADAFQEETRTLPVAYWQYEDVDGYHDEVTVQLPEGTSLTDIPADYTQSFKGNISYSIDYQRLTPSSLLVKRDISIKPEDIPVADYPAFKKFVDDIIATESRYVGFK